MKRILIIAFAALCVATFSHAQMSEKTGAAASEISPDDPVHRSKPVILKKYNTPEQRKATAAASEQDSTTRPPSRMELQMKPTAETPVIFPVK
jgi:hypothetical protein